MSTPAIEKLKDLVDPTQLVMSLGFSIFYDNSDEIRGACAIHGGDNKTAFCFRKASKRFYCYTHQCEVNNAGEVSNDIISLVMSVRRCGFSEAVKFLCDLTGFTIDSEDINIEDIDRYKKKKDKDKFVRGMLGKSELPEISEDLVRSYISNGANYFLSVGASRETTDYFQLGTMFDDFGVEWGAVPIRDENGRLVSISGRRAHGDEEPRYLLVKEFKKRKVLYNLHNARKFRDSYNRTTVIVEGFKALWHVYECGFPNVVAVMGSVVNPEQVNLLVKTGFERCILLLDGDSPGQKGMKKSLLLSQGKLDVRPIHLPQDVSPDDVEKTELTDILNLFMS